MPKHPLDIATVHMTPLMNGAGAGRALFGSNTTDLDSLRKAKGIEDRLWGETIEKLGACFDMRAGWTAAMHPVTTTLFPERVSRNFRTLRSVSPLTVQVLTIIASASLIEQAVSRPVSSSNFTNVSLSALFEEQPKVLMYTFIIIQDCISSGAFLSLVRLDSLFHVISSLFTMDVSVPYAEVFLFFIPSKIASMERV